MVNVKLENKQSEIQEKQRKIDKWGSNVMPYRHRIALRNSVGSLY